MGFAVSMPRVAVAGEGGGAVAVAGLGAGAVRGRGRLGGANSRGPAAAAALPGRAAP